MGYVTKTKKVKRGFWERLFSFSWFTPYKTVTERVWEVEPTPARERAQLPVLRKAAVEPAKTTSKPKTVTQPTRVAPKPSQAPVDVPDPAPDLFAMWNATAQGHHNATREVLEEKFTSGNGGDFGGGGASGSWSDAKVESYSSYDDSSSRSSYSSSYDSGSSSSDSSSSGSYSSD
jgi:hypothetical protein